MNLSTLWPGSWPPSPGLAPWAILICSSVGVDEVVGGHAEATRGDLLDGRAHAVAVGQRHEASRVLAALAGVGASAQAVHGDGQGRVGLPGDGPERHGPGGEALDDAAGWLDLLDGDGRQAVELEEMAQRDGLVGAVVDAGARTRDRARSPRCAPRAGACGSSPGREGAARRAGATGSGRPDRGRGPPRPPR